MFLFLFLLEICPISLCSTSTEERERWINNSRCYASILLDFESSTCNSSIHIINHGQHSYTQFPLRFTRYVVRSLLSLSSSDSFSAVSVVQTSFARTLATGQAKGPMDYVKQGVDQLGQAAEKVKEAVSSATSSVKDAVTGDQHASKDTVVCAMQNAFELTHCAFSLDKKIDEAKQHGL